MSAVCAWGCAIAGTVIVTRGIETTIKVTRCGSAITEAVDTDNCTATLIETFAGIDGITVIDVAGSCIKLKGSIFTGYGDAVDKKACKCASMILSETLRLTAASINRIDN